MKSLHFLVILCNFKHANLSRGDFNAREYSNQGSRKQPGDLLKYISLLYGGLGKNRSSDVLHLQYMYLDFTD